MKLLRLEFSRNRLSIAPDKEPLTGKAEFEDERGSQIKLTLDQEQASRILDICQESMAREFAAATQAMADSLKTAIELKKNTDIGNALPRSW